MKNEVSKNIFFNLIYRLVNLALPLITSPYLSRALGATAIGIHSYTNSIAFYFFSFAMLGVNTYGSREIAKVQKSKEKLSSTFWQIFYMQFFTSVILSGIYLIVASFLVSSCGVTAYIMAIYVLSATVDIDWFAFGLERFKVTTMARTTTKVLTVLLILLLVKNENDLWKYALIMQICNLFNFVFIWPIVHRETVFQKPQKKDIFNHFKPNIILFLPVIASSAYLYIDKIMIGSFISKTEVGYYNYAENIYSILCSINVAASSVLLSRSSRLISENKSNTRSIYKSSEYISIINIGILFGTLSVADIFIPWFLGEDYVMTALLLKILIPCVFITGITEIIKNQILIPKGMNRPYLISILVGAGVNIITNTFMIPWIGAIGASITTIVAYTVTLFIQLFMTKKLINYRKIFVGLIPFLCIGIFMYLILLLIDSISDVIILDFLLKVIIGGTFYVGMTVLFFWIKRRTIQKNSTR